MPGIMLSAGATKITLSSRSSVSETHEEVSHQSSGQVSVGAAERHRPSPGTGGGQRCAGNCSATGSLKKHVCVHVYL